MPALGDFVYVYWDVSTQFGPAGTVSGLEYTAQLQPILDAGFGTLVAKPANWEVSYPYNPWATVPATSPNSSVNASQVTTLINTYLATHPEWGSIYNQPPVVAAGANAQEARTSIGAGTYSKPLTGITIADFDVAVKAQMALTVRVDAYGADPTGVANSDAAVAAARSALGTQKGHLEFGAGTYLLTTPVTAFDWGQGVVGAGKGATTLKFSGTGDLFDARDPRAHTSGGPGVAGKFRDFFIDGTGSGANSSGLHVGDLRCLDIDIIVNNFTGANSIGLWLDNKKTWSERANIVVAASNCTSHIVFDSHGGFPSFDYGWFKLSFGAQANQDGVVLRNNVDLLGVDFTVVGNCQTGTTNTGTALIIGTSPTDTSQLHSSRVQFVAETGGSTGVGHKTITIGAAALLTGHGVLNFVPGNGIAFATGNAKTRTAFSGLIHVDTNLGRMTYWQANRTVGVATGSAGYMSSTGVVYLSANGNYFFQTMNSGAITMSLDSSVSSLSGQAITFDLFLKQPASGDAATFTWPSSFVWLTTGTAPTTSATANAVDHIRVTSADCVTFYAQHVNAPSGTIVDATTSIKGAVQLAGDFGGTAASPTVPALGKRRKGVSGGAAATLRRRDFDSAAITDHVTHLDVVQTITPNSTTSTIASNKGIAFMPSDKLAVCGGKTVSANGAQSSSYMLNWKYPVNGGSPSSYPNPSGWAVQFWVQNTQQIEFLVYAQNTGAAWNLIIDGRKVFDIPQTAGLTGAAQNLIKYDLGDSRPHRIRFEMQNLSLRTVFGQQTGEAAFVAPRGPRIFFLGDSTVQGASQSTGGELGSWIYRCGRMLGLEDIWNGGIGSTGFIANNGGTSATYPQRALTDVVPSDADIVVISSYYNDRSSAAADIAAALETTVTNLRTMTTPPMIIVIGSYDPTGSNGSPYTAIDAALLAKCTALGVPYVCPVTGGVYDGDGNAVIKTGSPWVTSTSKPVNVGADNVHQTDEGQRMWAVRVQEAIRALIPA